HEIGPSGIGLGSRESAAGKSVAYARFRYYHIHRFVMRLGIDAGQSGKFETDAHKRWPDGETCDRHVVIRSAVAQPIALLVKTGRRKTHRPRGTAGPDPG